MKIAPQHKYKDADYTPVCAWSEDTLVQWGRRGVVLSTKGKAPYSTAFFEAFPGDNSVGSFIRGEGADLESAERHAFAQYETHVACNHHWGRENYTNGGHLFRHCRAFQSEWKEIVHLGWWRKPIAYFDETMLNDDLEDTPPEKLKGYSRKLYLRRAVFGVTPRPEL